MPLVEPALAELRAYKARHALAPAWSPARLLSPHTQAAFAAATSLFGRRHVLHADGSQAAAVAALSDGGSLTLAVVQASLINGNATQRGSIRTAVATDGLARSLFELSASLWSNPRFLPALGDTSRLPPGPSADLPVPRGLEFVASLTRPRRAPPRRHARPGRPGRGRRDAWPSSAGQGVEPATREPVPGWLQPGLDGLDSLRRYALERSFHESMRFVFLHELAHVLLGHLDLVATHQRRSAISESSAGLRFGEDQTLRAGAWPRLARVALEIEADRYALSTLFDHARARQSRPDERRAPGLLETQLSAIGATLVPMAFHAWHVYSQSADSAYVHPPLWFRSDEVLRAEASLGTSTATAAQAPSPPAFAASMQGFLHAGALGRTLEAIGATHPLFGDWLGPSVQGSRDLQAEDILGEARHALAAALRGRERALLHLSPADAGR